MSVGKSSLSVLSDSPVEVYTARDIMEAHCVRGMLKDAGVSAEVVGDALITAHGGVPYAYPKVWVKQCDAARASDLVTEWDAEMASEMQSQPEVVRRTNYGTIALALAFVFGAPLTLPSRRHTERGNGMFQIAFRVLLPVAILVAFAWIVVFPILYFLGTAQFLR